jgi:hypothetical protein
MAPAIAPLATPTARGLAPARPAAHPIGAAMAPLAAMRAHTAGISSGFCRARAAPSTAASAAPPSTAPVSAPRGPRCAVSAAPARAPMAAANPIDCARLASTAPSLTRLLRIAPTAVDLGTAGHSSPGAAPPRADPSSRRADPV